jgi:hypothetical protein
VGRHAVQYFCRRLQHAPDQKGRAAEKL